MANVNIVSILVVSVHNNDNRYSNFWQLNYDYVHGNWKKVLHNMQYNYIFFFAKYLNSTYELIVFMLGNNEVW